MCREVRDAIHKRVRSANRRRTRLQSNPHRGTKSFWSAIRGVGEAPTRFGAGEQHAVHRRRGVPGKVSSLHPALW